MLLNDYFNLKQKLIKSHDDIDFLESLSNLELSGVITLFYQLSLSNNVNSLIKDICHDEYLKMQEFKNKKSKELILNLKEALEEDSFSKTYVEEAFDSYYEQDDSVNVFDLSFFAEISLSKEELNEDDEDNILSEINEAVHFYVQLEPVEAVGIIKYLKYKGIQFDELDALQEIFEKSFLTNIVKMVHALEDFDSEFKIRKHLKILEKSFT